MSTDVYHDDVDALKTLLFPDSPDDLTKQQTEDYTTTPAGNESSNSWLYNNAEYAQLDVDDSETTPLGNFTDSLPIHNVDNMADDDDDPKFFDYRLPTEGGSIFASFVSKAEEEKVQVIGRAHSMYKLYQLNMANSIIGAGIIGLPFAFKEAVSNKNIYLAVIKESNGIHR